jgi:hypothetical protein
MSGSTTELNLATAVDTDDNADYLTLSLANSLRTVDALFNSITGHNHGGAHQGGAIAPAAIPGGSITNAMLGADVARDNLLCNGSFEIWQRGTGPFTTNLGFSADRWMLQFGSGGTLSVSQNSSILASGFYSAGCTHNVGAGYANLQQKIENWQSLRGTGRSLSFSVNVYATTAASPFIQVDGVNTNGTVHTGNGTYQRLTVTASMASLSSSVIVGVQFAGNAVTYLDEASLVWGSQAANYVPMHPADDFARCLRYYEVVGALQNEIVFTFYGGAGITTGTLFGFKARKAITPTFTKNATWLVSNCGQPIILSGSVDTVSLAVLVTATGTTSYNNNIAGANVVMEANP